MERDFEIDGKKFKLSKLDPFKQFHVVRRLGPLLGDIIPAAKQFQGSNVEKLSQEEQFDMIAKFVKPIMDGLSQLTDKDAEFVLKELCSGVEVQHVAGWARICRDGNMMISDLELPVLLQVAGRSFMYNLAGFFAIAPQVSHGK